MALLSDYPFAGLLTVAELSKRANVSTQTILRLAAKLGFDGYPSFQQELIDEIKGAYQSPVLLRETLGESDIGQDFLSVLAEVSIKAIRQTTALISNELLETVSVMLADQRRSVFFLGGRITGSLASYLYRHLQQIRPKCFLIPESHEEWPDYLLRMNRNDVVLMFDFRRYQPDLELFAERASRKRKAKIILITDKWLSPVSKYSSQIFPCIIDVGTPWDTSVSAIILVEALINKVADADWVKSRARIEKWEALRLSQTDNMTIS
jgi:DNA-binding MurR/RpiR family transcriptional regulator